MGKAQACQGLLHVYYLRLHVHEPVLARKLAPSRHGKVADEVRRPEEKGIEVLGCAGEHVTLARHVRGLGLALAGGLHYGDAHEPKEGLGLLNHVPGDGGGLRGLELGGHQVPGLQGLLVFLLRHLLPRPPLCQGCHLQGVGLAVEDENGHDALAHKPGRP